ncbi:aliphatic sulfonate ABC transporter substrate-binding protein [Siculibacillus lacustris]|uniref:Putative aliphatic sulfonates-binding protein n=1 Tax=Siculibacillus lacustris TaxID=1549641 RepID=A0A4Q9VLP1_9HYPH|nr:aliphatic sulfonate ABC transporter substrate-binding protein [Siculibacillus lacustris]TBW35531.1 aliphatic sulfonate ABC transporter substrate-binding protein [Siculibacillus lacustris]
MGVIAWVTGAVLVGVAAAAPAALAADPTEVRVAYSSIVPESLIVKERGWIEQALAPKGIKVKWIESLGSNKTIEFLRGKSLDVGTSSLASAFLARANGTPIRYVYWTARQNTGSPILVRDGAPYKSLAELKGKKIAATPGTGPYISLIASLQNNGLSPTDVEIVSLQHPQGRLALATGRVEAWAGLDPDWAIAEIENKARVLYAAPELAGGGGLDVRDDFLAEHPDLVRAVLDGFERGRLYAIEHRSEAAAAFAETSKIDPKVAELVLARNDTSRPAVVDGDLAALVAWGKLYKQLGSIEAATDIEAVAREVLDTQTFKLTAK